MTTYHDDEITHYRARVDAIPTPEATPEPMSEERIAELREDVEDVLRETNSTVHRSLLNRYVGYLNECLDALIRLRAVVAERDATIERLNAEAADQLERFNTGWDHLHNNANETLAGKNREIAELKATHAEVIRALKAIRNHPVSDNKSRQRWCDAAIALLAGEESPDEH